jgi:hypothetical protein
MCLALLLELKMERSRKKGFFSVEIESKKHLSNVSISNKSHERVVIEGFLGELSEIEMIEDVLIQFKGANGVLRIDLSKDELWQKLSMKKEAE